MGTTPVCTYCGKLWPRNPGSFKDIPPVIAKEIRDHIQVCDKNPLVQQIRSLRLLAEEALPWINNKKPLCSSECLGQCLACKLITRMQQSLKEIS